MPSVSVVIPLFNKAPHIARAIESVLAQTEAPDEIVVVDDGSTDGSAAIVEGLAVPGLRLLRRSPPGPAGSAARNLGINAATSEWIALLDADDEWLPDHLAAFKLTLQRAGDISDVVAVFSGYDNVYEDGERRLDPFTRRYGVDAADAYDFSDLVATWTELNASPIWTSASTFRRDALIEAGLFPAERCSRGVDKDTWLRVCYRGRSLPTKSVTAVYHRESVNMVTKKPYGNRVPCIQGSIAALEAVASPADRLLLQRLGNIEIYNYAVATTKFEALRRDTWRGFRVDLDPLRGLILEALSVRLVAWFVRNAYGVRKRLRRT